MKLVMAIIKPFKLEEVRQALDEAGIEGLTRWKSNSHPGTCRTFCARLKRDRLVLLGLDDVSVDCLFAQCLARFQAMLPDTPNEDGCLLSHF